MKRVVTAWWVPACALLLSACVSAGGGTVQQNVGDNTSTGAFSFSSALAAQSANLNTQLTLNQTIEAGNFSGTVNLEVDRSLLDQRDPEGDVSISVSPSTVNLSPGSPASVTLSVDVASSSFSFSNALIVLRATSGSDRAATVVRLSVNPVLEIEYLQKADAGPHMWSVPEEMNVRPHEPSLTLRFLNRDPDNLRVHGNGVIQHQGNGGMPMGGVYELQIPSTETQTGVYYDHDDRNGETRRIEFGFGAGAAQAAALRTQQDRTVAAVENSSEEESCH